MQSVFYSVRSAGIYFVRSSNEPRLVVNPYWQPAGPTPINKMTHPGLSLQPTVGECNNMSMNAVYLFCQVVANSHYRLIAVQSANSMKRQRNPTCQILPDQLSNLSHETGSLFSLLWLMLQKRFNDAHISAHKSISNHCLILTSTLGVILFDGIWRY